MMSRTQKHLTSWISRVLLQLGEGKAILKLRIQDPGDFGRKDLLREYVLDPQRPAESLALEIEHDSQQEADGTSHGLHHFQLHAFRDGENKHFISTSFIVGSEEAPEESHPEADGRTLLAQAQRHNEAIMKIHAQERGAVMQGFGTIIHTLSEKLQAYESMQLQMLQLAQTNTIDRAKIEFDLETRKAVLELAKSFAAIAGPVVIPKLINKWMRDEEPKKEEEPLSLPEQTVTTAQIPAVIVSEEPANGHAKPRRKKEPS